MPGPHANSRRKPSTRSSAGSTRETLTQLMLFAARHAQAIGRWLVRERAHRRSLGARNKSVGDPVTDLDLAAEGRLRAAIAKAYPHHGFLGEETGDADLGRAHVWIVDPIDGTANFALGLPAWGVSVACLRDGVPAAGAVYLAPDDLTLSAALGRGTRADGRPIRVPSHPGLSADSVIGMQWIRGMQRLPFVTRLLRTGTRVRVFGSTVIQLADVVRGHLHANVQQQGRVWDVAAAGLLVQEAGGAFSCWNGKPVFPCAPEGLARHYSTAAASAPVHRQVTRLLRGLPVSPP